MSKNNCFELGRGAAGRFISSDRFNTTLISFHFYLPLSAETMTEDALIPYLLTSCSKEFKTITELNIKLLELYGAELGCSVSKSGDYLHSKISLSVIDGSFAYDNEDMLCEAEELLCSIIFNPSVSDEKFNIEDLEREKRKTSERIESEINNKRSYARTRLNEVMFKGEPYGKFVYGSIKELEKITVDSAYNAWKRLLSKSYIQVNAVGKELPVKFFERVKKELFKFERDGVADNVQSNALLPTNNVLRITDKMDVAQGKLVMGFSSEVYGNFMEALPLMLFSDIFGGGPYSRLFSNVREKLSLCYYCSAAGRRAKGYLIVDSGVEANKAEEAEKAILAELNELQNGNFDESIMESSKKAITDSLLSYYDNPSALDSWYSKDICDDFEQTPKDVIELINLVSKEDIIKTAQGIRLHTVYKLMPEDKR